MNVTGETFQTGIKCETGETVDTLTRKIRVSLGY